MKKLLIVVCITCALALAASAAPGKDKGRKEAAGPKTLKKEILEKYDANKDGKLDKDERAKISAEDKEKLEKAGIGHKKKKDKEAR